MTENIITLTDEILNDEVRGYSVRMPTKFHNMLKAQAALDGKTKDDYIMSIILAGLKAKQAA
jgi:predicted DNA-binding protein